MNIREATPADVGDIRDIARASLSSAYTDFLESEAVDRAIEAWYGDGFDEKLETKENYWVYLIEEGEQAIGFSECEIVGERQTIGKINWLHIHPDHRRHGAGVRLLVRSREELHGSGADQVKAFVLADNPGGNEFYASHGLERAGTYEVDIGGETFPENVYVDSAFDDGDWRAIEEIDSEGEPIYVSFGEVTRGSNAPFYPTYETEEAQTRYGWFCGACDSIDNAMDAMGRIECNGCGNRRKPTRWDSSYL